MSSYKEKDDQLERYGQLGAESKNPVLTDDNSSIVKPKGLGARHLQALFLFFAIALSFALETNLSIAIVAMTTEDGTPGQVFDWNDAEKGIILSSVYVGYIICQVPGSLLANRFGPKKVLLVASTARGLLTLITPWAAGVDWKLLSAVRFTLGLIQGVYWPCGHTILAKWIHPSELGLVCISYSGGQIGIAIMAASSAFIATSFMGWPGIFYCSGMVSFVWAILYFFFGANSPATCKRISAEEKAFLDTIPGLSNEKLTVPWKKILTSKPVIALLIAHCTFDYGFTVLLTMIPSYMNQVLHFDITSNGLLTALPYPIQWILTLNVSFLCDYIINKKYVTVGTARKLFNTIAQWGPMIALASVTFTTNTTIAVIFFCAATISTCTSGVSFLVNHMDLSPNFAGVLMGYTNTMANAFQMFSPMISGFILNSKEDTEEGTILAWRTIFFIAASIYAVGSLVFIFFGSATIQPWNEPLIPKNPSNSESQNRPKQP